MLELSKKPHEQMSAGELAQNTGVTEKYLEQILAILKKNGLVTATRGAAGGYTLSRDPAEIKIGCILRALEDNFQLVDCLSGSCSGGRCDCPSRNLWVNLQNNINDYLDSLSLKQILEENI